MREPVTRKYHIALSFAGEDRDYDHVCVGCLSEKGVDEA